MRSSLLALSLLALTLVPVELRRCAVIPACVTLSPYICAGAVIKVCSSKYWQQSGLSEFQGGKMDFIYAGSTCIIIHCPDILYYNSIELILSCLLFLMCAMWPIGHIAHLSNNRYDKISLKES